MITYHNTPDGTVIAELTDEKYVITQAQDFLDLIGDLVSYDCNRIILYHKNLHPDFFLLRTGVAGDILQKCSNYKIGLAIVGEFSGYESKSLQDFIRESNKGTMVFFLDTLEAAISKLTKN